MGLDAAHSFELRTEAGMGQLVALPLVCSLGASDALEGSRLAWPSGIVDTDGAMLADIRVGLSYEDGIVAKIELEPACELARDASELEAAVRSRVAAWEADLAAGRGAAGPLAPVMGEVFDRLSLMGSNVEALLSDGQVFARGFFAGISAWGRATLIIDGRELELSPEQASLRASL